MSKLILVLGIAVSLQPAVVIARALEFRSTVLIAGRGADSIVTGDFNGDRRLDIAVANRDADTISLFLGRGRGRFARARTFATGLNPRSLRAADVNGDGSSIC